MALATAKPTRGAVVRCHPGQEHHHHQLQHHQAHTAPSGPAPRRRARARAPLLQDAERAVQQHAAPAAILSIGPKARSGLSAGLRVAARRALRGRQALHTLTNLLLAASVLPAIALALQPLLSLTSAPAAAAAGTIVQLPPPQAWQASRHGILHATKASISRSAVLAGSLVVGARSPVLEGQAGLALAPFIHS
jgi:hypothetical protein